MITLTSVAANVVAISGGILVFHDTIGSGPSQITGRLLAFCFVIVGMGIMPAPTRTNGQLRDAGSSDHPPGSSASRSGPGDGNPLAVSRHRA